MLPPIEPSLNSMIFLALPRTLLATLGEDMFPKLVVKRVNLDFPDYELDVRTNNFFTKKTLFHYYYEIGKHFLCKKWVCSS